MKIRFKAFYYGVVTDDVLTKSFEAENLEAAYQIASESRPAHCEEDFDLYMDTMTVLSATIEDGFGNKKNNLNIGGTP